MPNLADLNKDGFLDIFITRHAPMSGGVVRRPQEQHGNTLLLSDGAWNQFRDVSGKMDVRNEAGYNRQPAFGDVNLDGWMDIAVGCDNIKDANGGFPHSRLYIFQPGARRFRDIGGTDLIPDFGGFYDDPALDKAGPDVNLVDLDNDGDLDLVQATHVDVMDLESRYSPIEYRQGIFCWKNLQVEKGFLQFEKITANGLAVEGRLRYDRCTKTTSPEGIAPGLPYVSFADTDNDGDLDILAVGPGSAPGGFAPRLEYAGGRFWENLGNFQFAEATEQSGLGPVAWNYGQWSRFFDYSLPDRPQAGSQPGDRYPYYSDAVFGDFDNDGWQDVVVLDRSGSAIIPVRAVLFMNTGDGSFKVMPTTFSGLDAGGISAEAADLDNDGLLDLVVASDPDNSGIARSMSGYESRIYWNTGLHGARRNNWLRMRFTGISDAELIGARIEVSAEGTSQYRWIQSSHAYKSGSPLEVHFGLGKQTAVRLTARLPDGRLVVVDGVEANQFAELDIPSRSLRSVSLSEQHPKTTN